jgi:UDP-glucose:(heptosyl)LPS alpha-1,3-glucosyltransferase
MRLALIRQRYTPYGGAERFVENALEALLERNVAITLYTREWPQTRLQLIEPVIVDPFYIGRLWRDLGFARAVAHEVGRTKLDLVQSHERVLCCDVYRAGDGVHAVWLEERLRDAPWWKRLATRLNPWHRYVLSMERRLFASHWLQAVICNSTMVRDEIAQRFGVAPERLRVIHNPVDSQAFHPGLREGRAATLAKHRIPSDALVYLIVGSGYERKGVKAAIQAIAELAPASHLIVVGRDNHIDRYRALAEKAGVAARVTFVGPVSDPKPYYGCADVFVLPTLYDPFPNAALEALACGLPVVTTTKSGAAELVLQHDAGLVCDSRDLTLLVAHMRSLEDAGTRERMGRNGRAAVAALTADAMTLKLVMLYKELLESIVLQQRTDMMRKLRVRRETRAPQDPVAAPPSDAAASGGAHDPAKPGA